MFDVIIIGAGVIGASVARELSRYKLNCLVLERESDVGDKTSMANSAIVHSGYDPHQGTLKAKYNVWGNKLFPALCEELDVEFAKIGSITIATKEEQLPLLDSLLENGKQNGVDVCLLSKEELWQLEPFATKKAIKALWAKDAGIVNPFELVVALMENAMDNGVKLNLDEEVIGIEKKDGNYLVKTDKGEYQTKVVINAAGLNSDEVNNFYFKDNEKILPRKGEYYVLDHFDKPYVSHVLFSLPSELGKGVLVSPTTHNNYLIGPSSDFVDDKEDFSTSKNKLNHVVEQAKLLVDEIPLGEAIKEFAGLRAYHKREDFIIEEKEDGFINLMGIQSPGLASSPAIGIDVKDMVIRKLNPEMKETFIPRRKRIRMDKLSLEEKKEVVKKYPEYGQIICRCENVSLGAILDSINRNCGARTIKGVKKRCRPGFGKCQGGFCEPLINKILASCLNKGQEEINLASTGSYILTSKTKEVK